MATREEIARALVGQDNTFDERWRGDFTGPGGGGDYVGPEQTPMPYGGRPLSPWMGPQIPAPGPPADPFMRNRAFPGQRNISAQGGRFPAPPEPAPLDMEFDRQSGANDNNWNLFRPGARSYGSWQRGLQGLNAPYEYETPTPTDQSPDLQGLGSALQWQGLRPDPGSAWARPGTSQNLSEEDGPALWNVGDTLTPGDLRVPHLGRQPDETFTGALRRNYPAGGQPLTSTQGYDEGGFEDAGDQWTVGSPVPRQIGSRDWEMPAGGGLFTRRGTESWDPFSQQQIETPWPEGGYPSTDPRGAFERGGGIAAIPGMLQEGWRQFAQPTPGADEPIAPTSVPTLRYGPAPTTDFTRDEPWRENPSPPIDQYQGPMPPLDFDDNRSNFGGRFTGDQSGAGIDYTRSGSPPWSVQETLGSTPLDPRGQRFTGSVDDMFGQTGQTFSGGRGGVTNWAGPSGPLGAGLPNSAWEAGPIRNQPNWGQFPSPELGDSGPSQTPFAGRFTGAGGGGFNYSAPMTGGDWYPSSRSGSALSQLTLPSAPETYAPGASNWTMRGADTYAAGSSAGNYARNYGDYLGGGGGGRRFGETTWEQAAANPAPANWTSDRGAGRGGAEEGATAQGDRFGRIPVIPVGNPDPFSRSLPTIVPSGWGQTSTGNLVADRAPAFMYPTGQTTAGGAFSGLGGDFYTPMGGWA